MKAIKKMVEKFHKDEKGQTFIEMAFIIILIIIAMYPAVKSLQTEGIQPKYDDITDQLESVTVPDLN
ncbi:Flp pilus assembly protein, pilin Flp [Desulfotomaculum arcticum]|uniref:Flp pilus assembly protein, pilin Flp n=1 Tax=Desulfotruncus arcticus DSM 17038 TaxID=1121424 RepID=A0A1I2Z8Q5_9FIRM|nr:hypothetical protein [Desulfotruncus arcticus]SFH33896.1 Flp pilus assembly protein, pilin Flp [Desulfotomaculum arcticum] [Desulfotruncus arcticus DSM 17038]